MTTKTQIVNSKENLAQQNIFTPKSRYYSNPDVRSSAEENASRDYSVHEQQQMLPINLE